MSANHCEWIGWKNSHYGRNSLLTTFQGSLKGPHSPCPLLRQLHAHKGVAACGGNLEPTGGHHELKKDCYGLRWAPRDGHQAECSSAGPEDEAKASFF